MKLSQDMSRGTVVGKIVIIIIIYLFTAIGLSPGGSGYFTCKQNMKSVTTKLSREGYMRSM